MVNEVRNRMGGGQDRIRRVGEPERVALEGDLGLEFVASGAPVAPAEVLELALGGGESLLCSCALLGEVLAFPREQTAASLVVRKEAPAEALLH